VDRAKAVSILKEILFACRGVIPFMAIIPPNPTIVSKGYQLYIKASPDTFEEAYIQDIVNRNNLAIKDYKELLIIYKP
jgi:hypothetical protein